MPSPKLTQWLRLLVWLFSFKSVCQKFIDQQGTKFQHQALFYIQGNIGISLHSSLCFCLSETWYITVNGYIPCKRVKNKTKKTKKQSGHLGKKEKQSVGLYFTGFLLSVTFQHLDIQQPKCPTHKLTSWTRNSTRANISVKELVHPKITFLSLITHPNFAPNL